MARRSPTRRTANWQCSQPQESHDLPRAFLTAPVPASAGIISLVTSSSISLPRASTPHDGGYHRIMSLSTPPWPLPDVEKRVGAIEIRELLLVHVRLLWHRACDSTAEQRCSWCRSPSRPSTNCASHRRANHRLGVGEAGVSSCHPWIGRSAGI